MDNLSGYGERVHEEHDELGVVYALYVMPDDAEVRGNALASGDDVIDEACEREILERLESGNIWAWASVACVAEFRGHRGVDTLGCCSYASTADFIASGDYWDDMKRTAKDELVKVLKSASVALVELAGGDKGNGKRVSRAIRDGDGDGDGSGRLATETRTEIRKQISDGDGSLEVSK